MQQIRVRLRSGIGDTLGHLVRAMQMLGSYGDEWRLLDLGNVHQCVDDPTCLEVTLLGHTDTTPEQWAQIEREVRWALGADHQSEGTLEIGLVAPHGKEAEGPMIVSAAKFREMAQWGHTEALTPPDGSGHAQPSLGP